MTPSPHAVALGTKGNTQGVGLHENDPLGESTPSSHETAAALGEYPAWHAGAHDAACGSAVPFPHAVAYGTTGSTQGLGAQVKFAGESTDSMHDSADAGTAVYPG